MVLPVLPQRKIEGISAIRLPFNVKGEPNYDAFLHHLERTVQAGFQPAINMDTGYVNLLSKSQRSQKGC